jgi:hypothetical protein
MKECGSVAYAVEEAPGVDHPFHLPPGMGIDTGDIRCFPGQMRRVRLSSDFGVFRLAPDPGIDLDGTADEVPKPLELEDQVHGDIVFPASTLTGELGSAEML